MHNEDASSRIIMTIIADVEMGGTRGTHMTEQKCVR